MFALSAPILAIIVIAVIVVSYVISVFNTLQRLKTQITASIQEIGNQLKRQASLIPNLQAVVKKHLSHEKDIINALSEARQSARKAEKTGRADDISKAIEQVQSVIPQINVVVEDNPELKTDETLGKFMDELRDTADKIMYARRSVIDLSQSYNVQLVTFPSNVVAGLFGFKQEQGLATPTSGDHLSVSKSEMQDIKVNIEE